MNNEQDKMRRIRNSSIFSLIICLLTIASLTWSHGMSIGAAQKVIMDSSFEQEENHQPDVNSISTATSRQPPSSATSSTTGLINADQNEELSAVNFTTNDLSDQDYEDLYGWDYDLTPQKEWKDSNYSSDTFIMRKAVVTMPDEVDGEGVVKKGRIYDVGSWKGGPNNQELVAFYLSTEVGVSAGQRRNGSLFDIAVAEGDEEYKNMMTQMQQDLKGDRSEYYAQPDLE